MEVNSSALKIQGRQILFSIIHDISVKEQINTDLNYKARVLSDDEIVQYELAQENLHIYPVELEMQNHELHRSQVQLEAMSALF